MPKKLPKMPKDDEGNTRTPEWIRSTDVFKEIFTRICDWYWSRLTSLDIHSEEGGVDDWFGWATSHLTASDEDQLEVYHLAKEHFKLMFHCPSGNPSGDEPCGPRSNAEFNNGKPCELCEYKLMELTHCFRFQPEDMRDEFIREVILPLEDYYSSNWDRCDAAWSDIKRALTFHLLQKEIFDIPELLFNTYLEYLEDEGEPEDGNNEIVLKIHEIVNSKLELAAYSIECELHTLINWRTSAIVEQAYFYKHLNGYSGFPVLKNMPESGIHLLEESLSNLSPGIHLGKLNEGVLPSKDSPLRRPFEFTVGGRLVKMDRYMMHFSTLPYLKFEFFSGEYASTIRGWEKTKARCSDAAKCAMYMLSLHSQVGYNHAIDLGNSEIKELVTSFLARFLQAEMFKEAYTEKNKTSYKQRILNAARLCILGHSCTDLNLKFITASTALECLVKSSGGGGITDTIGRRCSALLEPERKYRPVANKYIKELYNKRSAFIHADPRKNSSIDELACENLYTLLSSVILAVIYRDIFQDKCGWTEVNAKERKEKNDNLFNELDHCSESGEILTAHFSPIATRKLWLKEENQWGHLDSPLAGAS